MQKSTTSDLSGSCLEEIEPSIQTNINRREIGRRDTRSTESLHQVAVAGVQADFAKLVLGGKELLFDLVGGKNSRVRRIAIRLQIGAGERPAPDRRSRHGESIAGATVHNQQAGRNNGWKRRNRVDAAARGQAAAARLVVIGGKSQAANT